MSYWPIKLSIWTICLTEETSSASAIDVHTMGKLGPFRERGFIFTGLESSEEPSYLPFTVPSLPSSPLSGSESDSQEEESCCLKNKYIT